MRAKLVFMALPVVLMAGQAGAETCISPKVNQAICSDAVSKREAVHRHEGVKAVKKTPTKSAQRAPRPERDLAATARETRRRAATARTVPLIMREIEGLTGLLRDTKGGGRARLLRRLADTYAELESIAFAKKIEARARAGEVRKRHPKRAAALDSEAGRSEKIERAARSAAIRYYDELRTRHPTYCENINQKEPAKSTGCVDDVMYNLAYEHEQGGRLDAARKVYFELIQKFPASRYVPRAYLAFGELFFNEAQGDPSRWELAEQSYREVTKFPAPDNTSLPYAYYKLGYVYWNKGDHARAMESFKKAIDVAAQVPSLPGAGALAAAARRDMVPLYALGGNARRAYAFFRKISGDAGAESGRTLHMLDALGQSYLDIGRYHDAIVVYEDLLARDRGPKRCGYQAQITTAAMALRSGDKRAIKAAVDRQLEVEAEVRASGEAEDVKRACSNTTVGIAVETAMAFHLEAVGAGGVRGTGDKKTMEIAASLYEAVVSRFPREAWSGFRFPEIVREDWPTLVKVRYAMADLLYAQKDWAKCGPAFDAVAREEPNGPLAAESRYTAAICYQSVVNAAPRPAPAPVPAGATGDDARFEPRELTASEQAMVDAFDRFLCARAPARGDAEGYARWVEVKYARARTYFQARRWAEAAAGFRDIAMNHSDHEAGPFAAQLYLESLNVIGSRGRAPNESCLADMGRDTPKLYALYCDGDKGKGREEECGGLLRVERDVMRARAERLTNGVADGPTARRRMEEGANLYYAIWTRHGQAACRAREPGCDRMDEVLHNAARAYQAAGLLARAVSVRKVLIDPTYNLDRTPLGRGAVRDLGANYQAIAVYDEAASYYERFARESPKAPEAPEALQDAVVLRLGLGQEDAAAEDAARFARSYASTHGAQAARIAFAMGAHAIEHEHWDAARKRLSAAMATVDRSATADVRIQAHALLGRALQRLGRRAAAAAEHRKVRALFNAMDRGPDQGERALAGLEDAQIGKVFNALGEAIFFEAEQQRRIVDRIRFPAYRGAGGRDDVLLHIRTKVADWMKRKQRAIEEAERAYVQVLALRHVPPRWALASGARVGQMWSRFVAEFRAAPIPKEWGQPGWEDVRGAYLEGIDVASEPYRQRAKAAYEACLRYSVTYQHFDESSRACEVWLAKTYGSEYHAVDELRASPSWVGTRVVPRPAALPSDRSAQTFPQNLRPTGS